MAEAEDVKLEGATEAQAWVLRAQDHEVVQSRSTTMDSQAMGFGSLLSGSKRTTIDSQAMGFGSLLNSSKRTTMDSVFGFNSLSSRTTLYGFDGDESNASEAHGSHP